MKTVRHLGFVLLMFLLLSPLASASFRRGVAIWADEGSARLARNLKEDLADEWIHSEILTLEQIQAGALDTFQVLVVLGESPRVAEFLAFGQEGKILQGDPRGILAQIRGLNSDWIFTGSGSLSPGEWEPHLAELRVHLRNVQVQARLAPRRLIPVPERVSQNLILAERALAVIDRSLKTGETLPVAHFRQQAQRLLDQALLLMQPVREAEVRAVWVDAHSINRAGGPAGLRRLVGELADMGVNLLLPEVFYKGMTIYPSDLTDQDPVFARWAEDPLEVLISEAELYGMEVHAWVWAFAGGYGNQMGPVLRKNPDWVDLDREGSPYGHHGIPWLDASSPQARQFLMDLYQEVLDRYEFHGLHIDYIRYNSTNQFGFSQGARARAQQALGFDPLSAKAGSEQAHRLALWREENINSFVRQLRQSLDQNLVLSAAVWPGMDWVRRHMNQNWVHWAENGYVDFLVFMSYVQNVNVLGQRIGEALSLAGDKVYVYPGIGLHEIDTLEALAQIQAVRAEGGLGVSFFSTFHLTPQDREWFTQGPFALRALIPHADPESTIATLIREHGELLEIAMELQPLAAEELEVSKKQLENAGNLSELVEVINQEIERLESLRIGRRLGTTEAGVLRGSLAGLQRVVSIRLRSELELPYTPVRPLPVGSY